MYWIMKIIGLNPTFIEETYVVGTKLIVMEILMNDVDVLFVLFNNWCQMILLIGLKVQLQGSFVLLKCDTSKTN